jgi:POT family proton-dependent oligopeptide transporter
MSANKLAQPQGLAIFFFTEMWERYGYYVVQAMLALFASKALGFSDVNSYAIASSFTALAYLFPIVGGYLADKVFGYRHAVILGGMILCIGYLCLAKANTALHLTFALSVIAMGTGLFKPNVSSLLGTLYQTRDPRCDSGYTLFYVGINLGTLLATLIAGYLVLYFGWSISFISAALALAIGTLTFILGTRYWKISDRRQIHCGNAKVIAAYILLVALVLLGGLVIHYNQFALTVFGVVCIGVLAVLIKSASKSQAQQRRHILAYFLLLILAVLFWAIYYQLFLSLGFFIDRTINHKIFGLEIPTVAFISVVAGGIIVFGPLLGKLWTWLGAKGKGPSTAGKFTLGMLLLSASFGILVLGIKLTGSEQLLHPSWIVLSYLVLAIAELSLSPIGLAMVVQLVPERMVGMMMGIFFLSISLGGKLAGLLANLAAIPIADLHNLNDIKAVYCHAFTVYGLLALAATVLALVLMPWINRLTKPA